MSLLDDAMIDVVFLEKTREPDGEGGFLTSWREGAPFKAAITFDSSIEARVGSAQGVKSLYTVTTRRGVVLGFHDVFRRISDGKIFRVTSDGEDKYTPGGASLDMRQVTAEEWVLI
jgi:hypothetical protein